MDIDFYVRINTKGFEFRHNKTPCYSWINANPPDWIAVYANGQTSLVEVRARYEEPLSVNLTLDKTKRFLIYKEDVYFKITSYSKNIPIRNSNWAITQILLRKHKRLKERILKEKERRLKI